MSFKIGQTYYGKPEAQVPQNTGMAIIAQRKLEQVVGQANRKYAEAMKVDGYKVRCWNKNSRGMIPCTCSFNPGMSAKIAVGTSNDFGPGKKKIDKDNFDLMDPKPAPDSPASFTVRGAGVSRHPNYFNNRPLPTPEPTDNKTQLDVSKTGFEDNRNDFEFPEKDVEQDAVIDLSDLANKITGGEKTVCSICIGTGFVDGYLFMGGMRIVLDNSASIPTLNGAEIDSDARPNIFILNLKNTVIWDVKLPTYFHYIPKIKIKNNKKHIDSILVEASIDNGNTWVLMTEAWLNGRNGTSTVMKVRARAKDNTFESTVEFTHIEFLVEMLELPWSQFPQILKSTTYEHIDYMAQINFELDPSLPPPNRESLIENTFTGELWKITDQTPRTTSKGQWFGGEYTIRKVQEIEQAWQIKYGYDKIQALNYRGIEYQQGKPVGPIPIASTPSIE